MNDLDRRIENLSPAKRTLLEQLLKQKAAESDQSGIASQIDRSVIPLSSSSTLTAAEPDRVSIAQNDHRPATCRLIQSDFTAPQNSIQEQLATIWIEVLGLKTVGIHDNFFELGGYSLLAVSMFESISKTFGQTLPLSTLFQHQTIAELATVIHQSGSVVDREWDSLVMIKQGSDLKPPLFCIHDVSGTVFFYRQLVNYLLSDLTVYAIQPQGLDGKKTPISSISAMATYYISEIRKVQPVGPYSILGYSFGGLLAVEISTQLHDQGQEIDFLGIIDTMAPMGERDRTATTQIVARPKFDRNFARFAKFLQLNFREKIDYIRHGLRIHRSSGKLRIPYRMYLQYIERSLPKIGSLDIYWTNCQAAAEYIMRSTYPGKVTLFCSGEKLSLAPQLNWNRVATGGVDAYVVPDTNHATIILEPHVKLLAEQLTLALGNSASNVSC